MKQERMTAEEYRAMDARKSKYRNQRVESPEGIAFDSKAEYTRYCELEHMKRGGEIKTFERQPSFILIDGSAPVRYRPDFIINGNDGSVWVEDVKGYSTREFELKRKLWAEKYPNIPLVIIPAQRR